MTLDGITAEFADCILQDRVDVRVFVAYREDCRERKDFKTSDWIRDRLAQCGVKIDDTRRGTRVKT
jgi:cysteinyl-tRNA synthetase